MLYRHVFDKTSTEFRVISRIYLNFVAPRPHEISEALKYPPFPGLVELGFTLPHV